MYKLLAFIFLVCSSAFICDSDKANPDDQLLITNESSSDIYAYVDAFDASIDTISCALFSSLLLYDDFYIKAGSESLLVDDFANGVRQNSDLEIRIYVYKVAAKTDVPLCPEPIESLADTVVIRTANDLDGDNFVPVIIR